MIEGPDGAPIGGEKVRPLQEECWKFSDTSSSSEEGLLSQHRDGPLQSIGYSQRLNAM